MRIGCLQFAPVVGDVENNLNRADAVLSRADPVELDNLDILVLPEMAFTGYNFKSLQQITPFLEPSGSGISSLWARTTALKLDCVVAVGYPERVRGMSGQQEYYNSLIVVNGDGETVANYRKSFLYYTDEKWASEGSGFFRGEIRDLGQVAMGICMDINPYKFETPWSAFEFAFHILEVRANLVIVSMAWLTLEDGRTFTRLPQEPDMETLTYWVQRLEPVIRAERDEEIIVVFANRCGTEDDCVYAGTSVVFGIQAGEVSVYGLLGRGVKELLVIDTDLPPFAKLVNRPDGIAETEEELQTADIAGQSALPSPLSPKENLKSPRTQNMRSPVGVLPSTPEDVAVTDDEHDDCKAPQAEQAGISKTGSESVTTASEKAAASRDPENWYRTASPREGSFGQPSPTAAREPPHQYKTSSPRDDFFAQRLPSPGEFRPSRKGASPREDYFAQHLPSPTAPREAPNRHKTASPRENFFAQALPSPGEGKYFHGVPSPREAVSSGEVSPRGHVLVTSSSVPHTPSGDYGSSEGTPIMETLTYPSPTPMSARPKLAISTGPEALPPLHKKDPPPGMEAGNHFTSRDPYTPPPDTPFEGQPQFAARQHWVAPPSAVMYTPEEPEWPFPVPGKGVKRPSLATGLPRAPSRAAPSRPASRTQEVRPADLDNLPSWPPASPKSRHAGTSNSRMRETTKSSVATGGDRMTSPKVTQNWSKPSFRSCQLPPEDRLKHPGSPELETMRRTRGDESSFPTWNEHGSSSLFNSIPIAASPSVFQTSFPRVDSRPEMPPSALTQVSEQEADTANYVSKFGHTRSRSISGPLYQPTQIPPLRSRTPSIASPTEQGTNRDRVNGANTYIKRPRSASSERATKFNTRTPITT